MACQTIICALQLDIFLYALAGGVLPALLWMWFWLHEDNDHDEPESLLIMTFLVGMASVFFVIPLQAITLKISNDLFPWIIQTSFIVVLIWAFWEELAKYLSARWTAFKHPTFTKPIDVFIYMMTAALGFSAMENTMLLMGLLIKGHTVAVINQGAERFMGASLLHFLTSSAIALCLGLTFYASKSKKLLALCTGFAIAVVLHSLYNFFIIENDKQNTFPVLLSVWILVILLTISLERVKRIKNF